MWRATGAPMALPPPAFSSTRATTALGALSVSLQVSANNLANVNTNGFKQSDVRFETGPGDQGVRISEIRKDATPGSPVEAPVYPIVGRQYEQHMGWVESSNTDVARQFVDMISASNAWKANVATIRTADEMMGTLVDAVV